MGKKATSLYLDEAVLAEHGREARRRGLSLSEHVNDLLARSIARTWPDGFFDLAGAIPDLAEPPELCFADDGPREGWL
jgi:hypothetical protein